jgi:hypothetical protein
VLLEAGLVSVERSGREWIYVLQMERLNTVTGGWLKWFDPKEELNVETKNSVRLVSAARR